MCLNPFATCDAYIRVNFSTVYNDTLVAKGLIAGQWKQRVLNNYDEFDDWNYVYGYSTHYTLEYMLYTWPALNSWPVKEEGVKYNEFDDWNYVYHSVWLHHISSCHYIFMLESQRFISKF